MEESKIIAINIGPIYDTMQLATKPAGLWAASYLFSYISRRLTEMIKNDYRGDIITPYFEFDDASNRLIDKGVGFYHDHILVRNVTFDDVCKCIEEVKNYIGEGVYDALVRSKKINCSDKRQVVSYVENYLQVVAIEVEDNKKKNVIDATSKELNALELMKSYIPTEDINYFSLLLEDNNAIKNSFLVCDLKNDDWMLLDKTKQGRTIRDILSIARSDSKEKNPFKRYKYYALVSSDGDRMGKIIDSLENDGQVKSFSQKCLEYNQKACDRIIDFGGVVIYAGGDDLQFIAPLTRKISQTDGKIVEKTIFGLINDIVDEFKQTFKEEIGTSDLSDKKPSISFGVMIAYYRYPLYEVLNASHDLLYKAKRCGRDRAAVRLVKHSGQSAEIIINSLRDQMGDLNCSIEKVARALMPAEKEDVDNGNDQQQNEPLMSVIDHLNENRAMFEIALEKADSTGQMDVLDILMSNTFDSYDHKKWTGYLGYIEEIMRKHGSFNSANTVDDLAGKEKSGVDDVISFLRVLQFFGERGEE